MTGRLVLSKRMLKTSTSCLLAVLLMASSLLVPAAAETAPELCTSDADCAALTGDPDATCSTSLAFAPNSELKTFVCTIEDTTIASIVEPEVTLQCHTGFNISEGVPAAIGARKLLGGAAATPFPNAFCEIQLKAQPTVADVTILCTMEECDIAAGVLGVPGCQKTTCECDTPNCGTTLIKSVVDAINGLSSLDCDESGACSVKLNIPMVPASGIQTTCKAAECLTPLDE